MNTAVEGGSDQSFPEKLANAFAGGLEATLVRDAQFDAGGPGTTR